MRGSTAMVTALLAAAGLAGCFGSSASDFPPGLEPLEENSAPPLAAQPGDPYPEGASVVTGTGSDFSWGHGRGYIHAPAAAVWAAVQDPEVIADRRQTDEQSWVFGVEPAYEQSFAITYVVHDLIDVSWEETFRFGLIEGVAEAPVLGISRSQKTFGLNLINLIEGSIIVRRIDDTTTEIEIIRHLDAYMAGEGDIRPYVEDMYQSVRARAHGEPLPVY